MRWIYDAEDDAPGAGYCKQMCGEQALAEPCEDCERPRLLPDNVETVNVFHACDTQWRFLSNGMRAGLEYPAVKTVMEFRETENKKDVFQQLKTMESEVLTIELAKRQKSNDN